jgi:hypothetical protein
LAKRRKPPPETAAPRLLEAVAGALNACQRAGIAVKLRHGIVMTPAGYILEAQGGTWVARTLAWTAFSSLADDEDG